MGADPGDGPFRNLEVFRKTGLRGIGHHDYLLGVPGERFNLKGQLLVVEGKPSQIEVGRESHTDVDITAHHAVAADPDDPLGDLEIVNLVDWEPPGSPSAFDLGRRLRSIEDFLLDTFVARIEGLSGIAPADCDDAAKLIR
ncbi:MAG: hypothetical protein OEU49_13005, partial [Chromatiales bacterium]|nr:hypothetical protein [Chromatiales bacterium]